MGRAANLDEKTTTYYLIEGPPGANLAATPSGLSLTESFGDTKGWEPTRPLTDKPLVFYTAPLSGDISGGRWAVNLWYKRLPAPVSVKVEVLRTDAKGGNEQVLGSAEEHLATDPKHPWHHNLATFFVPVSKTTLNGDLLALRITKTAGGEMEVGFNANDYDSNFVIVGTTPFKPLAGGVMNFTFRNCTNVLPDSAVSWTMDQKTWHPLSEGKVIPAASRSAARMYVRLRFPDAVSGGGSREYMDFVEYNLGGAMLINTTQVDALVIPLTIELVDTAGKSSKVGISESQPALIAEFLKETPEEFHKCVRNNRIYQPPGDYPYGPDKCAEIERNVKIGTPEFTNPDMYYQKMPCNMYSKFMHVHSINGRAYGFAYDDDQQQDTLIVAQKPANLIVSIYWMDKGAKLPKAGPNAGVPTPKPFGTISATAYDDKGGGQNENGDTDIGFFNNEDWLDYNALTFNPDANAIDCVIASSNSGGKFEVRLDTMTGPKIGECTVEATGGWSDWKHVIVPITPTKGTHNLYIVGTSGSGICNFKEFSLIVAKPKTSP